MELDYCVTKRLIQEKMCGLSRTYLGFFDSYEQRADDQDKELTGCLLNVRHGTAVHVFSAECFFCVTLRTWDQVCYLLLVDFECFTGIA